MLIGCVVVVVVLVTVVLALLMVSCLRGELHCVMYFLCMCVGYCDSNETWHTASSPQTQGGNFDLRGEWISLVTTPTSHTHTRTCTHTLQECDMVEYRNGHESVELKVPVEDQDHATLPISGELEVKV